MRPIDGDELIELIDSYIKVSNQVDRSASFVDGMKDGYYRIRSRILNMPSVPSAQPEHLTDDDFETIRIHLNAYKERLGNQHRWEEAEEYQQLIDRFMSFAEAQRERMHGKWIPVTNGRGGHECSLCHTYAPSFQTGNEWLTDYCGNCGAKMEESE